MRNNNKIAILLGASGLVGSSLLSILLDSVEYSAVRVFVRKSIDITHPKLIEHIIDFDRPEEYSHLVKGDDLFCCLGTTIKKAKTQEAFRTVDYCYPVKFAEIAKENEVKQFLIVSSIGANANSSVFYLRTKGECEEAIKRNRIESISIFRPASLLGKRKEFRFKEKIGEYVLKIFSILLVGSLKKYKPIHANQVANAMFFIAQSPQLGFTIFESDIILTI